MASGDTLLTFHAKDADFPTTNFPALISRNNHKVLAFDTTTQETCFFEGVMPRNYANGGVTVYLTWAADTATTGTGGWDVSFERIGSGQQDLDADGFATAQTVTAATVPSVAGNTLVTNVAITNGANMDGVVAGEAFRLRIRRDVANDTASGDLHLLTVEIKET